MVSKNSFAIEDGFRYGCLRALRESDADGMLEWMHDESIASVFQTDFVSLCREDVLDFIEHTHVDADSLHFAVTGDDEGEYMGTVSLKHIDIGNQSAEYAISMRSCAHGSGLSMKGTKDALRYAFTVLGLHRVYLNVRSDNRRAKRFYEKIGFVHEGTSRDGLSTPTGYCNLDWYSMLRDEFAYLV